MSITETGRLDIIATRPDSNIVRLVITDHLDWGDYDNHAALLQAKINAYLEFVESGQLARVREPEIPKAPNIHIVLALQYPPTVDAETFLAKVRGYIAGLGMTFVVELRDR